MAPHMQICSRQTECEAIPTWADKTTHWRWELNSLSCKDTVVFSQLQLSCHRKWSLFIGWSFRDWPMFVEPFLELEDQRFNCSNWATLLQESSLLSLSPELSSVWELEYHVRYRLLIYELHKLVAWVSADPRLIPNNCDLQDSTSCTWYADPTGHQMDE